MSLLHAILLLLALARLLELRVAGRNTRRLLAAGAIEAGQGHYPMIVALHLAWFASLLLFVPAARPPSWAWLAFFLLLQPLRVWIIASLGRFWTTRVVSLPGAPLVALVFGLANALIIAWRIRIEDQLLAPRRQ